MKKQIIEMACEKYDLNENQKKILKKELNFKINKNDKIIVRPSGNFNHKMEIIYQAFIADEYVENKLHICYL
jgi:translation initiation factor IF-1